MNPRHWLLFSLAGLALALAGCGPKTAAPDHDHDHAEHAHDDEAEESGGVTFTAERGLRLSPAVIKALEVRLTEAAERPLAATRSLTAQVFATAPRVLATARLAAAEAESLRADSFAGARLVRIDTTPAAATRLADVVFELTADPAPRLGDFVTITVQSSPAAVLTVPRSAILDSATGTFVYVVDGEAYRRTPVQIGAHSADLAEITAGLRAGDRVVATPVEQLWLAELRLTKGGGHSH